MLLLIHKNTLVKIATKKLKIFFKAQRLAAKSLILCGLVDCITSRQFVKARMKSAVWPVKPQLHTKLSTEFVDRKKIPYATVI